MTGGGAVMANLLLSGATDIVDSDAAPRTLGSLVASELVFLSGNAGGDTIVSFTDVDGLTVTTLANNIRFDEFDDVVLNDIVLGNGFSRMVTFRPSKVGKRRLRKLVETGRRYAFRSAEGS